MKKKIIKYLLILITFFVLLIFYETTEVSYKIINRDFISIDINNARNPQIKKFLRFLDSTYTAFLLKFDNKTKLYFKVENFRDDLPEEKIINKTDKFSENLYPVKNNGKLWLRNYGNSSSNRFSSLKQINKNNLEKLDLAWDYEIKGKLFNDIQSNVIVAENKIFIPSYNKKIISLDAVTGKEIWELELSDYAPRRGMVYLKGDTNQTSKLFFPSYKNLVSINASDGTYNKKFGNNGKVKLKNPSITAPAIFKDNLIITTSKPSIEVYDSFRRK